jgi:protein SCO1/2
VKRSAFVLAFAVVLLACGGSDRELVGYQREPAPVVAEFELPDLSNGGEPFPLRAAPGELLLVYFGYTNCPDFCPTTLSDARLARQRLDDPGQVSVAMVAVDPDRDLPILDEYVAGFFPDQGHALGTDDPGVLAQVAAPFGAQYDVTTNDEGEIDVAHTTQLYAVNDAGEIVLIWQFGVPIEDLAGDMEQLLEQTA